MKYYLFRFSLTLFSLFWSILPLAIALFSQSFRASTPIDIFGGDTISGIVKHMKVSNANKYIEDAKRDLMAFRDELGDIRDIEGLNIDIGGFLTFADFFFDGLIADIFVQSKINDARRQVKEAIAKVEGILRQLRAYY